MPPPRKIDLLPSELYAWLAEELKARGFAEIEGVTEALNVRLEESGLELRLGKTAVGEHSKVLKAQRDALSMAEVLVADMDIDGEANMHRGLMQMIAAAAMQMMMAVSADPDAELDPKALASLSRMLKDLMHSAGLREKLLEAERDRVAKETREKAADDVAKKANELGLTPDLIQGIRAEILGVAG